MSDLGRVHFVGIGGAGMSAVASLLAARGVAVSGSDAKASDTLSALEREGIEVHVGSDPSFVETADTVVLSSAIRESNPVLVRARERGARILHRSQALALGLADKRVIAVAGAHGKSTTSAMIAHVLTACGLDPTYVIGAVLVGQEVGFRLGASDLAVIEADESDRSFLNYRPAIAVVTNIEADHLDNYADEEDFFRAFEAFAGQAGTVIACSDDPGAARLAAEVGAMTYGVAGDVAIEDIRSSATGTSAHIRGSHGRYRLDVPAVGRHNGLNATAAWTAAVVAGADPAAAAGALATFRGTGRRFEDRGTLGGVRIVDDYAHHPTEVAATLRAARAAAGDGRVLVLFQPHLFSRTKAFADRFAEALDLADDVVVCDIYASREDPDPAVSSRLITDAMAHGVYVADRFDAAREVARRARPGDVVLTVGAGDVTELGTVIAQELGA